MADTLTVTLADPLAQEVRAAAEARGLTPEDFVRQQLSLGIANDFAGSEPTADDEAALEEFARTRQGVRWDAVRAWMLSWGTPNELPKPDLSNLR